MIAFVAITAGVGVIITAILITTAMERVWRTETFQTIWATTTAVLSDALEPEQKTRPARTAKRV